MNRKHGPLSGAANFLSIFEAGRCPETWRQEQSRWVEWVSATGRNSCWISDLTNVELELCGQPLLGATLAALTSRNSSLKSSPVESTAAKATFSDPAHTRREGKSSAAGGLKSNRAFPVPEPKHAVRAPKIAIKNDRAESVRQLQPQANASFLRRLAGDGRELVRSGSFAENGTNGKRGSALIKIAERLQRKQSQGSTVAASRANSVERFAPATRLAFEPATLPERAARRIKKALERDSSTTRNLAATVQSRAVNHDLRSPTAHWSMPISGRTASASLLIRLAGSDRYHDQIGAPVRDLTARALSESPLPATHVAEQIHDSAPATAQARHSIPQAAPVIAPPGVTTALPPLHSHKQDDVVLPVAAATAQRQARIEEELARGDELPLLAERLDRILKQEARRHGIDV